MSEDRLERIETKLALSEDLLDELNLTLFRQQQQIEQLQQTLLKLHEKFFSSAQKPLQPADPRDEIPPHY